MDNKILLSALEHLKITAQREWEFKQEEANRSFTVVAYFDKEINALKEAIKKADEKKEAEAPYKIEAEAISWAKEEESVEQEQSTTGLKSYPKKGSILR